VVMTAATNRRLTEVGPGTPMGHLLRRYWQPIAAEDQFAPGERRPVRVLGEDLVLYRTPNGEFGLIERHCPHRRADLLNGYVEDDGIRCSYHGWKFDVCGRCVSQPFEEAAGSVRLKDRVPATAYRAEARFGLVWAYLGPDPAPLIPSWEPFLAKDCFAQIVFHEVPCNWLQCQENSIDPVHFEWLHGNWLAGQAHDPERYGPSHVQLGFDEWEYGFAYRRLHTGEDESSDAWVTGRLCIMPNLFAPVHFEWRVPIDDRRTLSVVWVADPVSEERAPFHQDVIPSWWGKMHDDDGTPLTTHVLHQDTISWVGQGEIADRTLEHLGRSDRGVQQFRQRLMADVDAVERGEDPSGLVRDPARNECIAWPAGLRRFYVAPLPTEAIRARIAGIARAVPSLSEGERFFLLAGQPEHVRDQWDYAMGLRDNPPVTEPVKDVPTARVEVR
jgi:5,5'-dehydrodivanillate O-demethylase oxygenase subunit